MNFTELKNKIIKNKIMAKIAVAQAEGETIFTALKQVEDFCFPIVIGNKNNIEISAKNAKLHHFEIIETNSAAESAAIAVKLIHQGAADLLMKGNLATDILLSAALKKDEGIKTNKLLSHVLVFETPEHKFLGITDSGVNIQPSLNNKIAIINNAVELFHKLGVTVPRVAILSAVEVVNPKIPSTLDGATLAKMGKNGEFPGAIINGPVSLDLAISAAARKKKNFEQVSNANADIILVPEIVCGNALGKALIHLAKFKSGGVVLGAKTPIVLLSRADSTLEKFNSIILGISACFTF
jgi:phosphate butyryltransferase